MRDVREDLSDLYRTLSQAPAADGGRLVLFMSARPCEGTSSLAASFAMLAAERARRAVWLVDLDIRRNTAFNAFAVGEFAKAGGGVSPPYSALLNTQPFFALDGEPDATATGGPGAFTVHRVGDTRLMVTQFDAQRVKQGQAIKIRSAPDYWSAMRASTDWCIVDAPALERSSAGLVVAAQMDRAVMVVRADATPPGDVAALRMELERHGARIAGAALNRVRSDARFFDKLGQ